MKFPLPKLLLLAEGLTVLLAMGFIYHLMGNSWGRFVALFFVPDISMLAYVFGKKTGAASYNALHTYTAPLLLGFIGYFTATTSLDSLALIWAAHIGFDRLLGYGLKYDTGFKDTHLGRV